MYNLILKTQPKAKSLFYPIPHHTTPYQTKQNQLKSFHIAYKRSHITTTILIMSWLIKMFIYVFVCLFKKQKQK